MSPQHFSEHKLLKRTRILKTRKIEEKLSFTALVSHNEVCQTTDASLRIFRRYAFTDYELHVLEDVTLV